jgi:hypothetical protein
MKRLFDIYTDLSQQLEDFVIMKVLPPIFKLMLFGMKLTLVWAFYLLVQQTISGI